HPPCASNRPSPCNRRFACWGSCWSLMPHDPQNGGLAGAHHRPEGVPDRIPHMVVRVDQVRQHVAGVPITLIAVEPCFLDRLGAARMDYDLLERSQERDAVLDAALPLLDSFRSRQAVPLQMTDRFRSRAVPAGIVLLEIRYAPADET